MQYLTRHVNITREHCSLIICIDAPNSYTNTSTFPSVGSPPSQLGSLALSRPSNMLHHRPVLSGHSDRAMHNKCSYIGVVRYSMMPCKGWRRHLTCSSMAAHSYGFMGQPPVLSPGAGALGGGGLPSTPGCGLPSAPGGGLPAALIAGLGAPALEREGGVPGGGGLPSAPGGRLPAAPTPGAGAPALPGTAGAPGGGGLAAGKPGGGLTGRTVVAGPGADAWGGGANAWGGGGLAAGNPGGGLRIAKAGPGAAALGGGANAKGGGGLALGAPGGGEPAHRISFQRLQGKAQ